MPSLIFDKAIRPDDTTARDIAFDILQSIRLLQLKCEILSVEVRQAKIGNVKWKDVFEQVTNARDPELGISDP
ncbi:hypothetical protein VNI00_005948 [Paramarasmius palmivorus]|uniref:Uncharacterized protein n=1 Tax=Paramarasmius palmivorus TaxID=297713 RepID=A0AAW0DAZ3_9AGAR